MSALNSVQLRETDLVIVVDDGSREVSASGVAPIRVGPTPVMLVTLRENGGIAKALRAGVEAIPEGFRYVARLDCGDTCTMDRFEAQRQFLDNDRGLVLIGSWVEFVDTTGRTLYRFDPPDSPRGVRNYMRLNCAVIHPTAMFRLDAYREVGGYSDRYPAAEDYALFYDLSRLGDVRNIPQPLVRCLTNDGGISVRNRHVQIRSRIRIMISHFDWTLTAVMGLVRAFLALWLPRSMVSVLRGRWWRGRARSGVAS